MVKNRQKAHFSRYPFHPKKRLSAALLALLLIVSAALTTACGSTQRSTEDFLPEKEVAKETTAVETEAADSIESIEASDEKDIRIAKDKAEIIEYEIKSDEEISEDDLKAVTDAPEVIAVNEIKVKKRLRYYLASVTVKGLKNGESEIKLQNAAGTVESKPLHVTVFEIATISFHEDSLDLSVGETRTVTAELTYGGIVKEDLSIKAADKKLLDIDDIDLQSKMDTTTLTFTVKARKTGFTAIEIASLSGDVSDKLAVTVKEKPTEKPTEKPVEKQPEPEKEKPQTVNNALTDQNDGNGSAEHDYILNTNTMRFHYPDCASVKKMAEYNKESYHGSRENLISNGYSPCGNCNP